MDDLIVDGNAKACGKAPIALKGRLGPLFQSQVFRDFVDVGRCSSVTNVLAELQQNFRDNLAGTPHGFDFFRALQMNHRKHSNRYTL